MISGAIAAMQTELLPHQDIKEKPDDYGKIFDLFESCDNTENNDNNQIDALNDKYYQYLEKKFTHNIFGIPIAGDEFIRIIHQFEVANNFSINEVVKTIQDLRNQKIDRNLLEGAFRVIKNKLYNLKKIKLEEIIDAYSNRKKHHKSRTTHEFANNRYGVKTIKLLFDLIKIYSNSQEELINNGIQYTYTNQYDDAIQTLLKFKQNFEKQVKNIIQPLLWQYLENLVNCYTYYICNDSDAILLTFAIQHSKIQVNNKLNFCISCDISNSSLNNLLDVVPKLQNLAILALSTESIEKQKLASSNVIQTLFKSINSGNVERLETLDISGLDEGSKLMDGLSKAISENKLSFLKYLRLNNCNIDNDNIKLFSNSLNNKTLPNLQTLNLSNNKINFIGLKSLISGLKKIQPLNDIILDQNLLDYESVLYIIEEINSGELKFPTKSLSFYNIDLTDDEKENLQNKTKAINPNFWLIL